MSLPDSRFSPHPLLFPVQPRAGYPNIMPCERQAKPEVDNVTQLTDYIEKMASNL